MVRATIRYRHVYEDVDRHGNVRVYFWRGKGHPKVRIRAALGSDEFAAEVKRLREGGAALIPARSRPQRPAASTWRWLCTEYFGSTAFRGLEPSTQTVRRRILGSTFAEPVRPGAAETFADYPLDRLTTKALRVLRDRKATLPDAGNNRVKAIRAVYKWASSAEVELVSHNPARDLARLRTRGDGHHSWTLAEIEQYEARWPAGSKERLALDLLSYTGVRRSDVVRLGRQHETRDGCLHFRPYKGRNAAGAPMVTIPILPPLRASLDAAAGRSLTYLETAWGRPFTAAGFGGWFRDKCDAAGLPQCSAHGLRKAGAARAAEAGASTHALMAIFGWLTIAEAERYTRAAERRRMARDAMPLLLRDGQGEG